MKIEKNLLYPESLRMEDGTVIYYRPLIIIRCMYCNRLASVIEFSEGGMGVTHEEPRCSEFTAMDPLTFIRENRKRMEKDIEEGKFQPN